ncbi:MAG: hypothetical protein S4CHLAM45_05490 [Chlamydiales bacterium]|nr:hypothetical protein [Chlamydiales bacterium]MCH9619910.1 hypothetical protein [Chlamydiales bacterium]MCH9622663.1 hypothetical protein [Chlamydiales bacterium]
MAISPSPVQSFEEVLVDLQSQPPSFTRGAAFLDLIKRITKTASEKLDQLPDIIRQMSRPEQQRDGWAILAKAQAENDINPSESLRQLEDEIEAVPCVEDKCALLKNLALIQAECGQVEEAKSTITKGGELAQMLSSSRKRDHTLTTVINALVTISSDQKKGEASATLEEALKQTQKITAIHERRKILESIGLAQKRIEDWKGRALTLKELRKIHGMAHFRVEREQISAVLERLQTG